jgi:N-acetylmuramoyl-L-alanine amidase
MIFVYKGTCLLGVVFLLFISACTPANPYQITNRAYKKQVKALVKPLRATPVTTPGADSLPPGDYWVGTTNFNLRKPNYVVIHHTAQSSAEQTLKTFTLPKTEVSAHYVIGRDGKVYHMLNNYLRAWHGGAGKWGNNTDLNSSSIGIELDNNGAEPFAEPQIKSLLQLLALLKKNYAIPAANFIGHSDIAPTRKNDPNPLFPWQTLAQKGFGLWYDPEVLADTITTAVLPGLTRPLPPDSLALRPDSTLSRNQVPPTFNPREALRIIGYDTENLEAAIRAFKIHFIQKNINAILTAEEKKILYNLYKKYL